MGIRKLNNNTFTINADGSVPLVDGSTATTQSSGDDSTDVATTAFVAEAIRQSIVTVSGTTKTLALSDNKTFQSCTNASAVTITVPPNSSVAFPLDSTEIDFVQHGAGTVTFAEGSGVTIRSLDSALSVSGQYAGASLKKIGTDEWALVGNLA